MQIPGFWAEARLEGKVGKQKRVVRRFGWSDDSVAAAQLHAQERAQSAFAELLAGRKVPNRERKLAYGGLGLPIREEVVARNGDDVITRNSYGARCLNEPDVLFADLDLDFRPPGLFVLAVWAESAVLGLAMTAFFRRPWAVALFVITIPLILAVARLVIAAERNEARHRDRFARRMRDRVETVAGRHPGARFALYATPAGMRVLALHATFDPAGEATQTLFRELRTDRAYAQMCALQACFRARVSPKPWRVDLQRPPTRGVWPVAAERMAERQAWVDAYETRSAGFAACRFVEELGDGPVDPRCRAVQQMHDELARARQDLPIA